MEDENLEVNAVFEIAASFINDTARHIFLTGKAGTGKTTFLRYIKRNTNKKMAVVAPTGVAAINAGGVTIHSLFQLPPGIFVPEKLDNYEDAALALNDPYTLIKKSRIHKSKRQLFRELELLVIDEVSMLRCDLLDAMDILLKHYRRQPLLPFGGIQVLYIGDLFQLPPVIKKEETALLRNYYRGPFFFEAGIIKQAPPIYLELKKIYRQNDQNFIALLNRIRHNRMEEKDSNLLHRLYQPSFLPNNENGYITLTTHNDKAAVINKQELEKLPGKVFEFEAFIKGDFPENACPADKVLLLKEGAQVMFIKNDLGEERRYYNGKIGKVKSIKEGKIIICFPDNNELELEIETWRNIRYRYLKEKDEIKEEELGAFTQYPVRLAWAVTIHKSQGLTFEKAVIDAGKAFAAGQVYVALSRCTSLDGIILKSIIRQHNIKTDERVIAFAASALADDELQFSLEKDTYHYKITQLIATFNCEALIEKMELFRQLLEKRKLKDKEHIIQIVEDGMEMINKLQEVFRKFRLQLHQLSEAAYEANDHRQLNERLQAGAKYFSTILQDQLLQALQDEKAALAAQPKVKALLKALEEIISLISKQLEQLGKLDILSL